MEFMIRKAVLSDVDGIMEEGKTSVEKPEWFVADDEAYIREHIEKDGFIIVAETAVGRELAGFFVVKVPEKEDNLGTFLGFDVDKLSKVMHMDSAVVGKKYRGNRLQARMLTAAEEMIESRYSQYRYLMCTVHPDNVYSLQNMERHGYQVKKTVECYGGLTRHVLLKERQTI